MSYIVNDFRLRRDIEAEVQKEVDLLLWHLVVYSAPYQVGGFMKKYGHKLKHLDKFRAEHFNRHHIQERLKPHNPHGIKN